ncbi:hypothetical protein [Actinoplanes sp. NPDC051851]|uniref:hypothetical protein n=1 Tax=Actinoplanes sp. NPDC051851 TaxID=3154753 RepID=UPI00343B5872
MSFDVPAPVRALSSLDPISYADWFTLPTTLTATAPEWARAMFGDAPNAAQWFIWRGLLGFPLVAHPSPDTIAGWPVTGGGDGWVRMEQASTLYRANLIVHTGDGRVGVGTFLTYRRPGAGSWWRPLSTVHRALIPRVLRQAATRLGR